MQQPALNQPVHCWLGEAAEILASPTKFICPWLDVIAAVWIGRSSLILHWCGLPVLLRCNRITKTLAKKKRNGRLRHFPLYEAFAAVIGITFSGSSVVISAAIFFE